MYHNYHKHDHKGNIKSIDVVVKLEDYCKRAVELGHTTVFTTNHGIQGDIFEGTTLAQEYGLKLVVGVEAYYVHNRYEKDRANKHIIIIALNDDGVRDINRVISESNISGVYYKNRIDHELLMSLNPKNIVITTACVAGIMRDINLVKELKDKFKDHFFLEIQNHNDDIQKDINRLALKLNEELGIKIIHGNDSHYINKEDSKYRDLFIKAKGINYPEEDGEFILDYPNEEEIVKRYIKQGVVPERLIYESIKNTNIFDKAEHLTIINKDIKLPSISNNPNEDLKRIIAKSWEEECSNVPKERHGEYMDSIRYEMDIIEKTKMENYFILDYYIAKIGQEKYGGKLTHTGRGSAPSFYINKLLGLTDIDRIESPITLFPTRFMSAERILLAKSLPDIDLNTIDRQPFIKATEDLLGEQCCRWMISWKPLQRSSAFRLYCKGLGKHISEYDEVAKNIDNYIDDTNWKDIITESENFVGVIESISESPCSMLVYDKNVAEEIGLIRTPSNEICCLLDGRNCDDYKYLKNDLLQVTVWGLIKDTFDMIGIPVPSIREFNKLLDDKTFEVYSEGLTSTINQVDSDFATGLVKKYKPKSLEDMSAFVASIRPGFASLLQNFIHRDHYTTGVKALDDLLSDSYSYLLYQESIMKYLVWLGVEEKETYDIIKKISKKKFKEKELELLKEELKRGWIDKLNTEQGFNDTWKVVEDASHYSFNASHSLSYAYDSLYGAYLKSHYPLEYYSVTLSAYIGDMDRTNKLTEELEYFNLKLQNPKFRYSKGQYHPNKETNTIYKGIGSIKFCNEQIGEELYSLRENKYQDFIEVLTDIKDKTSVNSRQLTILIKLGFFDEFGKSQKLLSIVDLFENIGTKKQLSKTALPHPLTLEVARKYAKTETEKLLKNFDMAGMISELSNSLENEDISIKDRFETELEYVGYLSYVDKSYDDHVCVVSDFKTNNWGTPFVTLYRLNNGRSMTLKVDRRYYNSKPIAKYDVIVCKQITPKPKKRKVDNKWIDLEEKEYILTSYGRVVSNENFEEEYR
ncbi:MAG: PHP domain-containing protein [Clostridium sp.]|uniref:PHP domain-containing protein n=1 Tax=Clostridium sp. TaxID=1506 RepID=UPI003F2BADE0